MPEGISHNNLNDISKVYLEQVSEGRLKQLEKASALSASDDPKDQDKAREIRVRYDYADLRKQINKKKKPEVAAVAESFSNWRDDLREIVNDAKETDDGAPPEVKEKKVKNKIKINPSFQESAEELAENLGGQLLSIQEVVDTEDGEGKEDPKEVQKKKMELQMKKRIIRMKLRAANSGEADGIVAGYEPEGEMVEGAVTAIKKVTKAGVKRHKKAVEDKKIKDRKAVPYAALAAEHQPEGEVVAEESKRTTKGRWVDKKGRSHKFSVSTHTGDEVHVSSIVKAQYPAKRVVITGQSADKKKKVAKKKVKEETTNEGLGLSMAATAGLTAVGNIAKAYGASQAAKGAIIGGALSGGGAVVGGALNYAASRNKKSDSKKKKVKEETTFKRASRMVSEDRDQAFKNVVARLQKKHGKDSVITKDNPIKPPTEAQKKAYAAHKAKIAAQDTRDELEKSSDGRYSLRHSNRGSD